MTLTIPARAGSAVRRRLSSTAAVLGGFVTVVVLSIGTDQLFHVLEVYPPWGEPMYEARLNLLALSYRILYTVLGGYVTASLAPQTQMRHVVVLGVIGFLAGLVGAIAAISSADLGPDWYPIAIAVTGFPAVWAGGLLWTARDRNR
jgi:hypothetical protein